MSGGRFGSPHPWWFSSSPFMREVLGHQFLNHDDPDYVFENPVVKKGLTVEGVRWAFGKLHGEHTYWHPLTWLSHMADVQLVGVNAGAHHLVNVFLHAKAARFPDAVRTAEEARAGAQGREPEYREREREAAGILSRRQAVP